MSDSNLQDMTNSIIEMPACTHACKTKLGITSLFLRKKDTVCYAMYVLKLVR